MCERVLIIVACLDFVPQLPLRTHRPRVQRPRHSNPHHPRLRLLPLLSSQKRLLSRHRRRRRNKRNNRVNRSLSHRRLQDRHQKTSHLSQEQQQSPYHNPLNHHLTRRLSSPKPQRSNRRQLSLSRLLFRLKLQLLPARPTQLFLLPAQLNLNQPLRAPKLFRLLCLRKK